MTSVLLIELEDYLRAQPSARRLLCSFKLFRIRPRRPRPDDHQAIARSIVTLCDAARLAPDPATVVAIEAQICECVRSLDVHRVNWTEFVPGFHEPQIPKAAVLKPRVSEKERGVVLINYEKQYMRLLRLPNLSRFAQSYTLVVGPSWHPPHSLVNCVFPEAYPTKTFTLISNEREQEVLPRISPKFIPLPLYGSSWVNPQLYHPLPPRKRDIDILMVANWAKFKRHFALFKALRRMPPELQVLLIGQDQDGRTADTILAEARAYGVRDRLTLMKDVPYDRVAEAFCRAKTSIILSRREGSCVAVAESLFADTPVAVYEDAVIGSRAFINEITGKLLAHDHLDEQLVRFVAEAAAGRYAPRQWADANISCFQSCHVMNDILKQHALQEGQRWTQDIAPVSWCPDQQLVLPEDRARMRRSWEQIRDEFGIELGKEANYR